MIAKRFTWIAAVMALACACVLPALGQVMARRAIIRPPGGAPAAGAVNLPYVWNDNSGCQWMFYNFGQFQQQGNMPVYSQGAMLQVNNNHPQNPLNQGKIDEKTGELILENMVIGPVSVTRRILINKEEGYVRYVDIIKNTQNQEQTVNLVYSTNTNYGVQMAQMVDDPKNKAQQLAWVAQTHANGRVVMEMFAGKGAKTAPRFQYNQGNSMVQVLHSPTIPAGKEIALMHFHMTTGTMDAAQKFALDMRESKIMASIPPAIRRLIINFRGGENFIGDYEILRGDILDVVELRTGDQLKGTIKEPAYKLQAFYGAVELPVDKVIGLINAGDYRPRQLLVTRDGEVFGGKLDRDRISLELSSGQVTEIPLSQVSRVGYRKRANEPEEWTFEKPVILMRSGDRILLDAPAAPIVVSTRYGTLSLKAASIAAIDFQSEDHGVHQVFLTDGSSFAGLVQGDAFEMKLAGGGPTANVKFPSSAIRRLQIAGNIDPAGDDEPKLSLANADELVGAIAGKLNLDTAFNTIAVNGGEIKKMVHAEGSPNDVQVTLWDETTVSGQLQEPELTCELRSGVQVKVPVALLKEYVQPRPQASANVVETIKGLVAELNDDDWRKRDTAQAKLIAMGVVVVKTLTEMRASQSPEAQQRIDLILKQIEKDPGKPPTAPAAPGAAAPAPPMIQLEVQQEVFQVLDQ